MQQTDIRRLKSLLEKYYASLVNEAEDLAIPTDDDDYGDSPYAERLDLIDRVIEQIEKDLRN